MEKGKEINPDKRVALFHIIFYILKCCWATLILRPQLVLLTIIKKSLQMLIVGGIRCEWVRSHEQYSGQWTLRTKHCFKTTTHSNTSIVKGGNVQQFLLVTFQKRPRGSVSFFMLFFGCLSMLPSFKGFIIIQDACFLLTALVNRH